MKRFLDLLQAVRRMDALADKADTGDHWVPPNIKGGGAWGGMLQQQHKRCGVDSSPKEAEAGWSAGEAAQRDVQAATPIGCFVGALETPLKSFQRRTYVRGSS